AADREIDAWEEMFIPFKVQEQVRSLRVTDQAGRERPLVAREVELYAAIDREAERSVPPRWGQWYLLTGLVGGGAIGVLGRLAATRRAAAAALGAVAALWGGLAGIVGVLLLGLWLLTDHTIAYRNASLLQM